MTLYLRILRQVASAEVAQSNSPLSRGAMLIQSGASCAGLPASVFTAPYAVAIQRSASCQQREHAARRCRFARSSRSKSRPVSAVVAVPSNLLLQSLLLSVHLEKKAPPFERRRVC